MTIQSGERDSSGSDRGCNLKDGWIFKFCTRSNHLIGLICRRCYIWPAYTFSICMSLWRSLWRESRWNSFVLSRGGWAEVRVQLFLEDGIRLCRPRWYVHLNFYLSRQLNLDKWTATLSQYFDHAIPEIPGGWMVPCPQALFCS